jgi:hypothetical protein
VRLLIGISDGRNLVLRSSVQRIKEVCHRFRDVPLPQNPVLTRCRLANLEVGSHRGAVFSVPFGIFVCDEALPEYVDALQDDVTMLTSQLSLKGSGSGVDPTRPILDAIHQIMRVLAFDSSPKSESLEADEADDVGIANRLCHYSVAVQELCRDLGRIMLIEDHGRVRHIQCGDVALGRKRLDSRPDLISMVGKKLQDDGAPILQRDLPAPALLLPAGVRVLDGLLYHESELRIEEHYTGTAGFTDYVFALCHLLGFRFAPRIRDLADKRLYVPGKPGQWPALSSMIGGSINTKITGQQLNEVLRLAASIQQGTVTASLILRKLGSYPARTVLPSPSAKLEESSEPYSCWRGSKIRRCGGASPPV